MTRFTLASFNLKNLIEAGEEYYRFEQYTPEEYRWKRDWTAGQLVRLNADIVGFQEIFEEEALRDVVAEADRIGMASNEASIPSKSLATIRCCDPPKVVIITPWAGAAAGV